MSKINTKNLLLYSLIATTLISCEAFAANQNVLQNVKITQKNKNIIELKLYAKEQFPTKPTLFSKGKNSYFISLPSTKYSGSKTPKITDFKDNIESFTIDYIPYRSSKNSGYTRLVIETKGNTMVRLLEPAYSSFDYIVLVQIFAGLFLLAALGVAGVYTYKKISKNKLNKILTEENVVIDEVADEEIDYNSDNELEQIEYIEEELEEVQKEVIEPEIDEVVTEIEEEVQEEIIAPEINEVVTEIEEEVQEEVIEPEIDEVVTEIEEEVQDEIIEPEIEEESANLPQEFYPSADEIVNDILSNNYALDVLSQSVNNDLLSENINENEDISLEEVFPEEEQVNNTVTADFEPAKIDNTSDAFVFANDGMEFSFADNKQEENRSELSSIQENIDDEVLADDLFSPFEPIQADIPDTVVVASDVQNILDDFVANEEDSVEETFDTDEVELSQDILTNDISSEDDSQNGIKTDVDIEQTEVVEQENFDNSIADSDYYSEEEQHVEESNFGTPKYEIETDVFYAKDDDTEAAFYKKEYDEPKFVLGLDETSPEDDLANVDKDKFFTDEKVDLDDSEPVLLAQKEISQGKYLYVIKHEGVYSLVASIKEEFFVVNKFDGEILQPKIYLKHNESRGDEDIYIVKIGAWRALLSVSSIEVKNILTLS